MSYNSTNNWICRTVEIAAERGIISKNNPTANAMNPITRIEALGIILKAAGINYAHNIDRTGYTKKIPQWYVDVIEASLQNNIITSAYDLSPDAYATRMDIIGMIYNLKFVTKKTKPTNTTVPKTETVEPQVQKDMNSA